MSEDWPLFKKLGFLFLAIYCFLYISGSQFFTAMLFEPLWRLLVPNFALMIGYKEPISLKMTGSGDTTYRYFSVIFFIALTVILTFIISIIDRKRTNYNIIFKWFTLLLRYYLAVNLISYGLAKVFYLQFGDQSMLPVDKAFGDISPMRLLWSFMAFSKGYTIFSGFLELVAGLLLLTRKTTLLGALLGLGVMVNVMILNYCYDVPVKLLSTHMVLFLSFLVILHFQSFYRFFFLGQLVKPYILESIASVKHRQIVNIIKWIIVSLYLAFTLYKSVGRSNERTKYIASNSLLFKHYVYNFEQYSDGIKIDSIPKNKRWFSINVQYSNLTITYDDEHEDKFEHELIKDENVICIKRYVEQDCQKLTYKRKNQNEYLLTGKFYNDSLSMTLKKKGYPLTNRGFHWINEYPYNR